MTDRVGTGDAAILHEVARYREHVFVPSGTPVRIWTHDEALSAYCS